MPAPPANRSAERQDGPGPRPASRWLGVDHGTRRIGVAGGSTADGIASPLAVVAAEPQDQALRRLAGLAADYEADGFVVGLPLNMDGTEGPQAKLARRMAAALAEATGLDVRLWDERLSSFAADGLLAGRLTRRKRKARQDALAAADMLREFLAADGPNTAPRAATDAG
jgi:putative Holliday junction resolvase